MEDDPYRYRKLHFGHQKLNNQFQENPTKRGKSCSHLFLKFLFIALFLSLIPLFPSQAPEFISDTIFAKTWELFHLLIIGIALSYGLFCRPKKSSQIPTKPQISQPYGANILQHTSMFDYENENPSGVSEKNAIPTQSCNLSYYRTEPFVVVGREGSKNYNERPLGLPVRSLRSRVLDSDSSCCNSDNDEEGASECESDFSSVLPRSGKDENFEGHEKKSRSMRVNFMVENDNVGEKSEPKSQSFRSPTEASNCQKNFGFCSWLPDSPNWQQQQQEHPMWLPPNMEGQNFWRVDKFGMPFSDFSAQGNGVNMMGISPNLHGGNVSVEKPMFFMPSDGTPGSNSMPAFTGDCSSRPRKLGHENVNLCQPFSDFHIQGNYHKMMGVSPDLQNGNLEKPQFFMPSNDDLRSRKLSHENVNLCQPFSDNSTQGNGHKMMGVSPNLKSGNLSVEKPQFFMPPTVVSAAMPAPTDDCVPRSRKFSHENVRSCQTVNLENGISGGEKADIFMPSAVAPSSVSVPDKDFVSPIKPSRSRRFGHDNGNLSKLPNVESGTKSSAAPDHSVSGLNDFVTDVSGNTSMETPKLSVPSAGAPDNCSSRSRKHTHTNVNLCEPSNLEDETSGGNKANFVMPSAVAPSSVSVPDKDFGSSVKPSRSRRLSHDNENLGKSPNIESKNLVGEKTNSVKPSAAFQHSVSGPENACASSIKRSRSRRTNRGTALKKDEKGLQKDNVGNTRNTNDSFTPSLVDPLSVPTPRDDLTSSVDGSFPKKDEQRKIPTRWDDDCFVIPLSENNDNNNDVGNLEQEDLSHGQVVSSESAGSISRRSSDEVCEVEENVPLRASTNSSEIEELGRDNIDSYKPSTPSPPPPPIQTRRNDVISPVESSSNTLVKGSSFSDDDDLGSPPTPERGKALSKASHSRRFSCTSFFDRDLRRGEAKEANKKSKGDQYGRGGMCGWDCLKLDVRPTLSKAALKGKSVRTIRPRETPSETNGHREISNENGASARNNQEIMVIQIGITEKRSNSNGRRGEKKQGSGATSIILGLNSKDGSKGKVAALCDVKEEETDNDEIDKKADEFIAKFKEQIRLQKVSAGAGSSRQQRARQNSLW